MKVLITNNLTGETIEQEIEEMAVEHIVPVQSAPTIEQRIALVEEDVALLAEVIAL